MKTNMKNDKLINETTENGFDRQSSEGHKSLLSIIDDPSSIPNHNRKSAIGNSGRIQTSPVSTKPNITLSNSFIKSQLEANKLSTNLDKHKKNKKM